jgi:signal transduction histidine kinase
VHAIGSPLEATPVDVNAVIDAAAVGLGLEQVVQRDQLPPVWGDAVLLKQLVMNLLSNASRYHDDDVPQIKVSAHTGMDGDVSLRFDDAGLGIPEHERTAVLSRSTVASAVANSAVRVLGCPSRSRSLSGTAVPSASAIRR